MAIAPSATKPALRALLDGFARNDLLLFASAISFQVLTALVPLALFALGALGFLGLSEVWAQDVRPQVVEGLSPAATRVIDDTVGKVLGSAQLFWVTAGAAIAIWQLSGAVRAAMEALNRVYEAREERSFGRRYAVSLTLAVAFAALTFSASSVVVFVPLLDGDPPVLVGGLLFLGRWGVAAVLLGLAVGLLVHQGPDRAQPLGWVSAGAVSIVGSWVAMSVAFGLYLSSVASYGSIYGALATVVVL
ncbi:MAG: YhjD/YihY/BrkB family envelope integrity protein, partial [Solirubrobacteraceae bacterium]